MSKEVANATRKLARNTLRSNMPKVDGKKFSYTKKGVAKAKKAAKKSGKKMTFEKGRKKHFKI